MIDSLRIAVADDELETREYFQDTLAVLGHQVVVAAETGRQLVEECEIEEPDLIITDIKMPDMDGLQAALELRRHQTVPIILVSAYHDPNLIERALTSHVLAYLVKPIKRADLETAIALAMRRFRESQALATELTHAEQRERRRLAQVLHDHLQQLLVAAKMRTGILVSSAKDEELQSSLQEIENLLRQSIETTRSLTAELCPRVLYEAGLSAALEWLGRWMQDKYGLHVDVQTDPEAEPPSEATRVLLFEGTRELLFNTVKHADVDQAEVVMERLGDRVHIIVSDRGIGFDPDQVQQSGSSSGNFGLCSIRQRLEWLGAGMSIESAPGWGSRVTLEAPIHRRHPQPEQTDALAEETP